MFVLLSTTKSEDRGRVVWGKLSRGELSDIPLNTSLRVKKGDLSDFPDFDILGCHLCRDVANVTKLVTFFIYTNTAFWPRLNILIFMPISG